MQGDDYVDWVGMSLYHFGTTFPYNQNVLPEAQKFTSTVSRFKLLPAMLCFVILFFKKPIMHAAEIQHHTAWYILLLHNCVVRTYALWNNHHALHSCIQVTIVRNVWLSSLQCLERYPPSHISKGPPVCKAMIVCSCTYYAIKVRMQHE